MTIQPKNGGLSIILTGDELARAVWNEAERLGVKVTGSRTVLVNGKLCEGAEICVDASASVEVKIPGAPPFTASITPTLSGGSGGKSRVSLPPQTSKST